MQCRLLYKAVVVLLSLLKLSKSTVSTSVTSSRNVGSETSVASGKSTGTNEEAASPSTVTITIQKSAGPSSETSSAVAYLTCFDEMSELGAKDRISDKGGCCSAMWSALRSLCSDVTSDSFRSAADETNGGEASFSALLSTHKLCHTDRKDQWERSCMERIAFVPPAARQDIIANDQGPTFLLSIWDEQSWEAAAQSGKATTDFVSGRQYIWDHGVGGSNGRWTLGASPFRLPTTHTSTSVPAKIMSAVPDAGGMHRAHHHRIVLSLAGISESVVKGNVTVLLPLSEGLFVDIDDALHNDGECTVASAVQDSSVHVLSEGTECNAELAALSRGTVVDIEQPSFASKQHVLAIEVSFELLFSLLTSSDQKASNVELGFASNLHLRYPPPTSCTKDLPGRSRMSPVYVPSTFIGGGHLVVVDNASNDEKIHSVQWDTGSLQDTIVLETAAGHDGDYIFVVLATLVASLVGSLVMIKDISRVSSWR